MGQARQCFFSKDLPSSHSRYFLTLAAASYFRKIPHRSRGTSAALQRCLWQVLRQHVAVAVTLRFQFGGPMEVTAGEQAA
jgi:hypothetical protein